MRWSEFFGGKQAHGEAVGNYITCCAKDLMDSGFECPHCDGDYMLLRKRVTGLSVSAMRQEVFRKYPTLDSVDKLRKFCNVYEAAQRGAMKLRAVASNDIMEDDVHHSETCRPRQPAWLVQHPADCAGDVADSTSDEPATHAP